MNMKYPVHKHSSFQGLIGVSQVDITPPTGIYNRNWGASEHTTAVGIHQPLVLTCLSFQQSSKEKPLVLISADLGWWKSASDEWALRSNLLEALELEPSQLLFCLTHTHAGPGICRDDASAPGGEFIEPYLGLLSERGIRAVKHSLSNAVPAVLTWHYGKSALATNRDVPQPGRNRFVVGYNPEISADDTLLVGRVTDSQDQVIATIVNYACHPTTLAWENRLISPDYVGSMRDIVQHQTNAPCLFLQGASGDLAPIEQYVGFTGLAEKYGRQLGFDVLATLEAMLLPKHQLSFSKVIESGAPLAIWEQSEYQPSDTLSIKLVEIQLPLKALPSLPDIEQQLVLCEDRVLKERLRRQRGVRLAVGDGDHAGIGLWIWRLGDSFLLGQPNEAYSQFQGELRRQLAPYAVGVINIANGHIGYLAPEAFYDKDIYSVWQSPFASGSLELLTKKALNVAKEMMIPNQT
ncbi:MAG: hypothetical protein ABIN89_27670 [Chitinophagaceae bacterium]